MVTSSRVVTTRTRSQDRKEIFPIKKIHVNMKLWDEKGGGGRFITDAKYAGYLTLTLTLTLLFTLGLTELGG